MTIHRRTLAAALVLAACAAPALAQPAAPWPTKTVRFVLPAAPGTAPDIMARVLGERLGRIWGQSVVIDNKPGAGGLIGLAAAKSADKDDHTLVFTPASVLTLTPYMYKSTTVDVVKDFVPVAMVGMSPMMLAVPANSPMNSLADVIAAARKQPDQFVVSTTFAYSVPHLAADLLARAAGAPLRSVPFAGSTQSIAAVVNNDSQAIIDGIPPIDPMVKGGRLKPIAIFSETRVPNRPQLPTVAETYPGMVVNGWFAMVAPAGTGARAIDRVNKDLATVLAMPEVVERLDGMGVYPRTMSTADFGKYWASERARWEKALQDVGAQKGAQS